MKHDRGTVQYRAAKRIIGLFAVGALALSACGEDAAIDAASPDRPTIVVSTNIMGDVVENVVGDAANVITIMPVGADPHDFQPSAQQIAQLNDADAVIVNGGGFEEGLVDIIEAAEADGALLFEAISAVETLEYAGHDDHGHDDEDEDHSDEHDEDEDHDDEHDEDEDHDDEHDGEHSDGEHDEDEDHDDEHDGEHSDGDPHFFSDPVRVADAAEAISAFVIAEVPNIEAAAVQAATDEYVAELTALDAEISETLSAVASDDRVLVTNHAVLTYFADRYDFEIIGTVIPGGTTVDSASAETLAELASLIETEGVPAVFSDNSSSDELAQTLALEAGSISVVSLYSESLGAEDSEGATYLDMMRTNAERIAEALSE